MKKYPSQEKLKELFDYDPEGFLVWRHNREKSKSWNTRFSGKRAGSTGVNKEMRVFYDIRIGGNLYSGSRLIFIWHHGFCPKIVAHKEFNQSNNKISNLVPLSDKKKRSAGHWKTGQGFRFVEKEKGRESWFNTIGKRKSFTKKVAAAFYVNLEIDRLGLDYQKNEVDDVDLDKFLCRGERQEKNRNNATSSFLGVSRHQKKWIVKCAHKYIGVYSCQVEAARAYNIAAHEHYGENAVLNDIPDPLGKGDAF